MCNFYDLGAPGTGKTVLLVEKVGLLAEQCQDDELILVTCFNETIRDHLEHQIKELGVDHYTDNIYVMTLKNLLNNCIHDKPKKVQYSNWFEKNGTNFIKELRERLNLGDCHVTMFKHIFVDESQGMPKNWYDLLLNFWEDKPDSYFWVNFDPSQDVSPMPNYNDNYFNSPVDTKKFKIIHLQKVFRCVSRQFTVIDQYIHNCCRRCTQKSRKSTTRSFDTSASQTSCNYCNLLCSVTIPGPEPLLLPWINKRSSAMADDLSEKVHILFPVLCCNL